MKKLAFWVIVIIILMLIGGLIKSKKVITEDGPKEPIKIGAIISLSGVAASHGEMAQKGMELARDEINKNGGMGGRMVELYIEDDETDPKTAVSAYQKVVSLDKVDAVVGGVFDFVAQPVFPLSEKDGITYISPSNFLIKGSFEMTEHSFVMYPEFNKVIRELKSVIEKENVEKMAIVRFQSDFGKAIEETLSEILKELGKEPLVVEKYLEIGGSDFRTNILRLKEENVDTVFLDMLDFDAVTFLKRAGELSFYPKIISYTVIKDALQNESVDKGLLEDIIVLDWEISSQEVSKAFEDKYNTPLIKSANKAYSAIYVLAEAIANTDNKTDVAGYIESREFYTPDGKIVFTSDHAVESTPVEIKIIKDGKILNY